MNPQYLAIGHITEDLLPDGSFGPGGTVTFSAMTARNLGAQAAIVTAAPAVLRRWPFYEGIDIRGPETDTATIFENVYLPEGRVQFVRGVAPAIRAQDVPEEWRGPASGVEIVHIGPVAQECQLELATLFPDALIGVTPQGFLRRWDNPEKRVEAIEWADAQKWLPLVDALILSIEDLPPGERGQELLRGYVAQCRLVVCTQGPGGCIVFQGGEAERVPAYPALEVDPTGCGDVFAAAFLLHLRRTADPSAAARFANAAASCNIEKPGATGVPTLAEVESRLNR